MRILLVEDEPRMAAAIRRVLAAEHYTTDLAQDGEEALAFIDGHRYDVVVLDRMLPGISGDDVLRAMRDKGIATPVLMLTALSALEHRVEGLDAGADDYLPKPFAFSELLARIRALTRRRPDLVPQRLAAGDIQLDPDRHQVTVDGQSELLSAREYALLGYLIRHADQVVTRQQILDSVWGAEPDVYSNVVDLYVHYLRRKLETLGRKDALRTVRGVGYALRPHA
ncbi:MAG TPA: response regulator transcription factor [Candidatus Limnocylindrales bacterium]|nr:response regulator transcription factor [Candidatus Limnocylindrales bacterium]